MKQTIKEYLEIESDIGSDFNRMLKLAAELINKEMNWEVFKLE